MPAGACQDRRVALFRRRARQGELPDGLPSCFSDALGRVGAKGGVVRRTAAFGNRADAWAVEIPGEHALELSNELGARCENWTPVIIGGVDDEARLAEAAESCVMTPGAILEAADAIDVDELLARWKADNEAVVDDEWDPVGEWPADASPNTTLWLPREISTGKPRTTVVGLVALSDPAEIPAALGWGGWNACPLPEEHVALLRRWSERYGARLFGISGDVVEVSVSSPPQTQAAATQLAHEQFLYCEDIVTQGTETISALAATLLNGTAWNFWWD